MMNALQSDHYQFDSFLYSPTEAIVIKADKRILLKARENELLHLLVKHYPSVTSRDVIHENLWSNSYTTDATINQTVKALRDDLGDAEKTVIRTIPKSGYMLGLTPTFVSYCPNQPPLLSAKNKAQFASTLPTIICAVVLGITSFCLGISQSEKPVADQVITEGNVNYFFIPSDIERSRFLLLSKKNELAKQNDKTTYFVEQTETGYRACQLHHKEMICQNVL